MPDRLPVDQFRGSQSRGIVVTNHDLTGIVVGVTILETRVVCVDRILD